MSVNHIGGKIFDDLLQGVNVQRIFVKYRKLGESENYVPINIFGEKRIMVFLRKGYQSNLRTAMFQKEIP